MGLRAAHFGRGDTGTGLLGVIGNVVWLGRLVAGAWSPDACRGAWHHDRPAVRWAHLKLAGIALWPIGKAIVSADDAPLLYPQVRAGPDQVILPFRCRFLVRLVSGRGFVALLEAGDVARQDLGRATASSFGLLLRSFFLLSHLPINDRAYALANS